MANEIKKYGKQVVVNTPSGDKTYTFTGIRANAILNRLNDNPNMWHTTDDTGAEVYFSFAGPCGLCPIATVTYTTSTIDALDCEDGLPNCPDATSEFPIEGYTKPVTPVVPYPPVTPEPEEPGGDDDKDDEDKDNEGGDQEPETPPQS